MENAVGGRNPWNVLFRIVPPRRGGGEWVFLVVVQFEQSRDRKGAEIVEIKRIPRFLAGAALMKRHSVFKLNPYCVSFALATCERKTGLV